MQADESTLDGLTTTDAVLFLDREEAVVIACNSRLSAVTGFASAGLVGTNASCLTPPTVSADRAFGATVWEEPGLHEDVLLARADGFVASVAVRVVHEEREGKRVALCLIRDETERRMLERELITKHIALRDAHQELEAKVRELKELSGILDQRRREIERLTAQVATVSRRAMLAEVAAEVAHSLNNPLGALSSTLRMMRRLDLGTTAGSVRDRHEVLLGRAAVAVDRMARVVTDLRHACRNGQQTAGLTVVSLRDEIEAAITLVAHRTPAGVDVQRVLEPTLVRAAPDEMHYIVVNLLENALRAVGGTGVVRISCGSEGAVAKLVVSDSGPGVDPALAETVFEPFFTTQRDGRGSGLGLSMVRRAVTRFGGTVDVEPCGPLGGASFRIALPEAQP